MLSILKHDDNAANKVLHDFNIDYEVFRSEVGFVNTNLMQEIHCHKPSQILTFRWTMMTMTLSALQEKSQSKSRTPVLDNFGRDVTRLADEGKIRSNHW